MTGPTLASPPDPIFILFDVQKKKRGKNAKIRAFHAKRETGGFFLFSKYLPLYLVHVEATVGIGKASLPRLATTMKFLCSSLLEQGGYHSVTTHQQLNWSGSIASVATIYDL